MVEHDCTRWVDDSTKELLNSLAASNVEQYRQTMTALGAKLAEILLQDLTKPNLLDYDICIACTAEDADFLGAGVFKKLDGELPGKCKLACFWNQKTIAPEGIEEFEIAPILKMYKEPVRPDRCVLVVAKSVILEACIVATNINNLVSKLNPKRIYVVAPVILTGSQDRLQGHFPSSVGRRFNYLYFAVDLGRDDRGWLDPGVGGSVHEKYRFGNVQEENLIVPGIVKTRRERLFVANDASK